MTFQTVAPAAMLETHCREARTDSKSPKRLLQESTQEMMVDQSDSREVVNFLTV